jgi:hypothetical protein
MTNNENEAANEKFYRAGLKREMGLRTSTKPAAGTALAHWLSWLPNSQKHQKRFCLWCFSTQRLLAEAKDPIMRTACRWLRE